jgi:hypothetical protein
MADICDVEGVAAPGCFKGVRAPRTFHEAIALALSLRELPVSRGDITAPTPQDLGDFLIRVMSSYRTITGRRAVADLMQNNGLSKHEVAIIFSYTLEQPYPLYKWVNAWLMDRRRDTTIKQHIGPYFVMLYRALEKLPRVTTRATRGVRVHPSDAHLIAKHRQYLGEYQKGRLLHFWAFASFTTEDSVATKPAFFGPAGAKSILFTCNDLHGVSLAPFSDTTAECEVMPLAPSSFVVQATAMVDQRLVVFVEQLPQRISYVDTASPAIRAAEDVSIRGTAPQTAVRFSAMRTLKSLWALVLVVTPDVASILGLVLLMAYPRFCASWLAPSLGLMLLLVPRIVQRFMSHPLRAPFRLPRLLYDSFSLQDHCLHAFGLIFVASGWLQQDLALLLYATACAAFLFEFARRPLMFLLILALCPFAVELCGQGWLAAVSLQRRLGPAVLHRRSKDLLTPFL